MKDFVAICKKTQKELKKFVAEKLTTTHDKVINTKGYVFAQGSFPVLLVAHLDTVHKELPTEVMYDTETQAISAKNGIGGDDRCGVYMILEIIKKHNCSVLFCEDEEVGGIGADEFAESKLAKECKFNYIIELDRKGEKDAVFYDCDNKDFTDFITKDFYKKAYGSFSDISIIAPALKCAAVNLSCGYYKAHTKDEYVIFPQMQQSIKEVCKILERTTDENKYEYVECKRSYYYYGYPYYSEYYGGYYGSSYKNYRSKNTYNSYNKKEKTNDKFYYFITYMNASDHIDYYSTHATCEAEAVGRFLIENSDLTYRNIIEIEDLYDDDYSDYSR